MNLELKHLAAYFPYGLKMKRNGFVGELITIKNDQNSLLDRFEFQVSCSNWWENDEDINHYKPILRPLSDLTKEIEVNGEKVIIAGELIKISDGFISDDDNFNQWIYNYIKEISIYPKYIHDLITECLLKNHFDIFNLIPNGLAIDINTLKNE